MADFSFKKESQYYESLSNKSYQHKRQSFHAEELLSRNPIQLDMTRASGFIKNKTVMITGAAGSIGRHLVKQIAILMPKKMVLIDNSESGIYELEEELKHVPEAVEIVLLPANITDDDRMRHIFERNQPQIIFHAAANKHVPIMEKHPYESIKTNILGTKILADLAIEFGVEKFVFISTDKAVNPTNVMGATKRCGEMYLLSLKKEITVNPQFVITRFGNVLGTNGSAVPLFIKQIDQGGPVTVTHPDVMRFFITTNEACQLVLEAGAIGQTGEAYILEMGDGVLLKDLAVKMILLSGFKLEDDIKIIYTGLRPGEKLLEERLRKEEDNMSSHDARITISHLKPVDRHLINNTIRCLESALESGDENEMVLILKDAIPEYISNNSEFEKLDSKRRLRIEG